jgi:hypothetical protein
MATQSMGKINVGFSPGGGCFLEGSCFSQSLLPLFHPDSVQNPNTEQGNSKLAPTRLVKIAQPLLPWKWISLPFAFPALQRKAAQNRAASSHQNLSGLRLFPADGFARHPILRATLFRRNVIELP